MIPLPDPDARASRKETADDSSAGVVHHRRTVSAQAKRKSISNRWFGSSWLSMAAGGLIAFALGWLSQESWVGVTPQSELVNRGGAVIGPGNTRLVEAPDNSNSLVGDSPEFRMSSAYRELLEALRQGGNQVQRSRGVVPTLENGRAMWVPVEDYYVVPSSEVMY